jgi:hypothetical protein
MHQVYAVHAFHNMFLIYHRRRNTGICLKVCLVVFDGIVAITQLSDSNVVLTSRKCPVQYELQGP